ncbi:MAG: site-specific DNA-methyltransferase [Candidatus Accumulibacter sp.]|uniref:Site-specific DNA-methyltransferase n=1 Tax=Candidatus Accumulibacter affinis TaxID=2954384 RepID=A0A935W3Z7_9PROT|nr:site-specific DNA-methyltransferase [Candidatus Accumulibacter affinis]
MPFLDWVNKAQAQRVSADVPYHLLQFESAHGDAAAENLLIQGDNLLALKALLPFYRGRVKCIYIDPPYNTQSAFEHYDDKLEHSQWLSMMWPRLVLLRELLAEDGSIWVSIDDREAHYLKVLLDEVFGRWNFLVDVSWQRKYSVSNNFKGIASIVDRILCYGKSDQFRPNLLPRTDESIARYSNPDDDPRGPWKAVDYLNQATPEKRPNLCYPIRNHFTNEEIKNTSKAWKYEPKVHEQHVAENRLWWGVSGQNRTPALKLFLSDVRNGMTPHNWWPHEEVGHTDEAKKESIALFGANMVFDTPKPERLIARILQISTQPADLVLDSFLGSATTAAAAHKMGRRYIGIEMGGHAVTHCLPRLQKVIAGEQGGISGTVGWQGGGGFRFHTLGEPVFDADGGIHPSVRFTALAAYLWHFETGDPASQVFASPLLGVHEGTAFYLLYNGILGDRRPAGGNVLTSNVLADLDALLHHAGPRVIYGETTRLGEARLREAAITFKQIPYDIKAR